MFRLRPVFVYLKRCASAVKLEKHTFRKGIQPMRRDTLCFPSEINKELTKLSLIFFAISLIPAGLFIRPAISSYSSEFIELIFLAGFFVLIFGLALFMYLYEATEELTSDRYNYYKKVGPIHWSNHVNIANWKTIRVAVRSNANMDANRLHSKSWFGIELSRYKNASWSMGDIVVGKDREHYQTPEELVGLILQLEEMTGFTVEFDEFCKHKIQPLYEKQKK